MFFRNNNVRCLSQSKFNFFSGVELNPYRACRLKSDILAPNNTIDNLCMNNETKNDACAMSAHKNQHERCMNQAVMPFDAIPCADPPSVSRLQKFTSTLALCRQLANGKWESRFHEDIDQYHSELGPIFRKTLGGTHQVVFVKSPQFIRDIFTYEGKYPKHPLPEAWTFYNRLHHCERGLFFMDDVEWLETRKQLAPLMLRNEDRFTMAITCATDHLIEEWQRISVHHSYVELPHVLTSLYGWSIRVLLAIMFGVNASQNMYVKLHEQIDAFAEVVQHIFDDTVPFSSISPSLAHKLRLNVWRKFEKSVTDTLDIAEEIIDYGCNQCHSDDGLLSEMKALGMTSHMIKRIFIDFVIAAGDTTAFTTQWAMYALAKDPNIQQVIRQSLADDKHDSPLIRGTVRETLRLYPVATFIGRILAKDAILGNYHINKHTLVYVSMYSAGRDEQSFPRANTFEPLRWNRDALTGALEQVKYKQSFIPFALGARNCIGQRIANAQMHTILTKLLMNFELKLLNAHEIEIVMRLIITPSNPIRFAVKKI